VAAQADLKEQKARRVPRVLKDHKVMLALRVQSVLKEQRGLRVLKVLKVK
jgi:hypothetical protein